MAAQLPDPQPVLLDLVEGRLLVDGLAVDLRPKTWEVLCVLVRRSGGLVTKDELLDQVWADTAISESTLSKSIGELRAALGDRTESPRFVETVPRRGFRWIGEIHVIERNAPQAEAGTAASRTRPPGFATATDTAGEREGASAIGSASGQAAAPGIVARDEELRRLQAALARAHSGRRQVVFVTGEAGAGKTTLIDSFLRRAAADRDVRIAHGFCVETSGPHEPYSPFLDALERLARDEREVASALRRCAPNWVARMPGLETAGDAANAVPGSMLRELTGAIDEIAKERPLVLVLEDAHWADLASTDALAALAARRDAAQLLLVVTKRIAEAVVIDHPVVDLRRNLVARQAAEEIALTPFSREALGQYLALRCAGLEEHEEILDWLLAQTAGNPLFVRLVVDEWIAQGLVRQHAQHEQDGQHAKDALGLWAPTEDAALLRATVPANLRALLERQLDALVPAERAVLEAASVRIGEFQAAAIAAASAMDSDEVENICALVARRTQLLRCCGSAFTASGLPTEQYAFLHATIQNVVAEGLPRSRWRRLNRAAAEQLAAEYAGREAAVSSQLAVHYEQAGEHALAIHHLREAGREAMRRDSPRDSTATLEKAIALIDANPQLPDAEHQRLLVLSDLSHARQLAFGFGDPEVARMWSRVGELAESTEDLRNAVIAHSGGLIAACVSGRYADAHETIRTVLPLAERLEDAGARKLMAFAVGNILYRTSSTESATTVFETAIATPHENDPVPGADLNALLMSQYAPAAALHGRPDDTRRLVRDSLEVARNHSHYSECVTGSLASWSLGLLHDFTTAAPIAKHTIDIANTWGFPDWTSRPLFLVGMSLIHDGQVEEGIATVGQCIAGRKTTGHWVDQSAMCCLYAEALMDAGHDGGDELLDQASEFIAGFGEFFFESEILRLRAKSSRRKRRDAGDGEPLLRRAVELATARANHWHVLLAATDLASLLHAQGRSEEARAPLETALAAMHGGEELAGVRRARAVLDEIGRCG